MKKLVAIVLTIVSLVLFLVGIFMLFSAGMKIFQAANGAELNVIKMVIVPVVISAAFLYSGKKLFINSFYEVIRK